MKPMKADLMRGHVDALVLATLEGGSLHGYAIIEALFEQSDGVLELPTGSVYPALRRLEEARYVSGRWSVVDGRRRRTYQLTRAGRRALAEERTEWQRFTAAVHGILGEPGPGGSSVGEARSGSRIDESGEVFGT